MPIYQVISKGDTLLPTLDGTKQQDDQFKYGDLILGPAEIYDSFTGITPPVIERTALGLELDGTVDTGSTLLTFILPNGIDIDAALAIGIDATRFATGSFIVAGNYYTAWGIVKWFDSATAGSYAWFKITGEGNHTAGSVESFFTFGSKTTIPGMAGGATATLATTNSTVDRNGTVSFAYAGADPASASVEIIFDPIVNGYYARMGRTRNVLTSPLHASIKTYVTATDVTNHADLYVSGSAGQLKSEKIFNAGAQVGDLAKITYYYYADSGNATKVTHTREQMSKVIAADLLSST